MNPSRKRLLDAIAHRRPDRLPMCDLTYWPETLARWRDEGLPADVDLADYFGLDRITCVNDLFEPSLCFEEHTIEQTDHHRLFVDRYGKTVKELIGSSSPPATVEPGLQTRDDWEAVKSRLTPGDEKFNNPAAEAQHQAALERGDFTAITPAEPVWFVLEHAMGFEHGLRAMGRDRALVEDMVSTYADYVLGMLELTVRRGMRFDALWFWSDLCYRDGLLFSPRMARALALPHWKRFADFAHRNGMRFIFHCDGDVRPLTPLLIEAGCDAIHPLEARAGNDLRELRPQFGDKLCFLGNINADVVATNDEIAIEREVSEKIAACDGPGGYIYHIDHSVPPTVSLGSYRFLLNCVRRLAAER